jgi:hypothetical protein
MARRFLVVSAFLNDDQNNKGIYLNISLCLLDDWLLSRIGRSHSMSGHTSLFHNVRYLEIDGSLMSCCVCISE